MLRRLAFCLGLLTGPVLAEDRALVIGIDSYPDVNPGARPFSAIADATAFAEMIHRDLDFDHSQITLLLDSAATSEAILNALIDELVGLTRPDDRVIFYFAGLGSHSGDGQRALLAHDSADLLGLIPEDALADIFDIINDRSVHVILDAGFTGSDDIPGQRGTGAPAPADAPFAAAGDRRVVLTASTATQPAWETITGGLLTQTLLSGMAGLADMNGNGTITNAELLIHLRETTTNWCAAQRNCTALTPDFAGPLRGQVGARFDSSPPPAPEPSLIIQTEPDQPREDIDTFGYVSDLFVARNDANLAIRIADIAPLRIGDVIAFGVRSERPGTLVLLDIDPSGSLTQIFPSVLAPTAGTNIRPGQEMTIPQNTTSINGAPIRIRVTGPAGNGFLLALLVEDDLPDLAALLPENLNGGAVPNAGQFLYDMAQDLLSLSESGQVTWSAAYLPYEITR